MKTAIISFCFVILIISNIYFFLHVNSLGGKSVVGSKPDLEKKFPYISKRVLYEVPNDFLINFLPLRTELRDVVKPYGDTFGFFFEYLPTGTSIGVNEKSEFESASLFKIPMIMAYYKGKERKGVMHDPVVTITKEDIHKEYGDLWRKGAGARIGLDEAVRLAIIDSDNTAAQIVSRQVEQQDLMTVYEGLDIDLLKNKDGRVVITAKGFSSVLKALFFSAVLTTEDSQQILSYMTQAEFTHALRAGVPSGIPVAHKIGVLNDNLFMDCGIVYLPQRPYSLCMVSSSNDKEAERRMIDISSRVYKFVKSQ